MLNLTKLDLWEAGNIVKNSVKILYHKGNTDFVLYRENVKKLPIIIRLTWKFINIETKLCGSRRHLSRRKSLGLMMYWGTRSPHGQADWLTLYAAGG